MIGIYKITNPKGKIYIGQSIDIDKRFKQYNNLLNCKGQKKLYNSLCKYGANNHRFEVVELCAIDKLNERERDWQEYYDVLNIGLNLVLTKTSDKSGVTSDEVKIKISKSNKGITSSMKGKKHTKETINKIKIGNIGKTVSIDTKKLLSEINTGGNHPKAISVISLSDGIFYDCIKDAAEAYGYNKRTLYCYLKGTRRNKSNIVII